MRRVLAGAAIGLVGSTALAQPADPPATNPAPTAPARQPSGQRPAREAGERPARPDGQPGEGRPDARRGGGDITNVESAMKLVNRSVRRLKQQVTDAGKKEENLRLVGDIERAVVAAKGMPLPDLNGQRGPRPGRAPGEGRDGAPGGRGKGDREQPGGAVRPDSTSGSEEQPEKSTRRDDAQQPGKKQPTPADPKKAAAYRRDLIGLLRQVLDVEQALMDENFDQAKAALDKLPQLRDAAHKELGVKDEDEDR